MKRILKISLLSILTACSLSCCANSSEFSLLVKFNDELSDEESCYYTGNEFESYIYTSSGNDISLIPAIYIVNPDNTESLAEEEYLKFLGFDSKKVGEQIIEVKYDNGSISLKTNYQIVVRELKEISIEAYDPQHYQHGHFVVGEKFSTYEVVEMGVTRGVTISIEYNDPKMDVKKYFTNDEEMKDLDFDTSECYLDADGRFTKAGEFEVGVSYKGLSTTYLVDVTEE